MMLYRLKLKTAFVIILFSSPWLNLLLASPSPPPLIISDFNSVTYIDCERNQEAGILRYGDHIYIDRGRYWPAFPDGSRSRITFAGGGSTLDFYSDFVSEYTYSQWNVIGENSVIYFSGGYNSVYLDELLISEGASLHIDYSEPSAFFVKKTSANLADVLTRVSIGGVMGVGVRDYLSDYWEIGVGSGFTTLPTPEPASYGVILSAGAFGLVAWRRRGRRAREGLSLAKGHCRASAATRARCGENAL